MTRLSELVLARTHFLAGRFEQARAIVARVLARSPGDYAANSAMAQLMQQRGDGTRALFFAERALSAGPARLEERCELAKMLSLLGERKRAEAVLRAAAEAAPKNPVARGSLGWHLLLEMKYAEAARELGAAAALRPDSPEYAHDLARAMTCMAHADRGVRMLADAIAGHPGELRLRSTRAFCLNYCCGVTPEEVFRTHVEFGRALAAALPAGSAPLRTPDPERRLTVGFLSPDLVGHSVAYFIRPLLEHLDEAAFRVVCYSSRPDKVGETESPPRCAVFRKIYLLSDEDLVRVIRQDGVDILIELSGHTGGQRLAVLHARAAPIQATYLGYCNTTGVVGVDFRIVDSRTDPGPEADALATERLIRLDPCFLCYKPPADAPGVGPLPSAEGAPITFGSFNALSKLNDEVIRVWSRVLQSVPGSRLLLKAGALGEEDVRADIASRFGAAGVEPERLQLVAWAPEVGTHLAMYGRVDIGLDPFPYNGTTTTADALWMGVPVVTLVGRVHSARVGYSMLSLVGLPELCASSPDELVRIAVALAGDRSRLAGLRRTMRERLSGSPLCDGPGMGRRFGGALRSIWRERCRIARA